MFMDSRLREDVKLGKCWLVLDVKQTLFNENVSNLAYSFVHINWADVLKRDMGNFLWNAGLN